MQGVSSYPQVIPKVIPKRRNLPARNAVPPANYAVPPANYAVPPANYAVPPANIAVPPCKLCRGILSYPQWIVDKNTACVLL